MPAFVAHFLIAKDLFAVTELNQENEKFFVLGSVGPDLPYYLHVLETGIGEFFQNWLHPKSPVILRGMRGLLPCSNSKRFSHEDARNGKKG